MSSPNEQTEPSSIDMDQDIRADISAGIKALVKLQKKMYESDKTNHELTVSFNNQKIAITEKDISQLLQAILSEVKKLDKGKVVRKTKKRSGGIIEPVLLKPKVTSFIIKYIMKDGTLKNDEYIKYLRNGKSDDKYQRNDKSNDKSEDNNHYTIRPFLTSLYNYYGAKQLIHLPRGHLSLKDSEMYDELNDIIQEAIDGNVDKVRELVEILRHSDKYTPLSTNEKDEIIKKAVMLADIAKSGTSKEEPLYLFDDKGKYTTFEADPETLKETVALEKNKKRIDTYEIFNPFYFTAINFSKITTKSVVKQDSKDIKSNLLKAKMFNLTPKEKDYKGLSDEIKLRAKYIISQIGSLNNTRKNAGKRKKNK